MKVSLKERLCRHFTEQPNGCWEWHGAAFHTGYGILRIAGRNVSAHRVSWEVFRSPIPTGLCVLHKCDNPPCVNPDHLFLGTRDDNNKDKVAKNRQAKGPFARHRNRRWCALDEDSVVFIRTNPWLSNAWLADALGVDRSTISYARAGKTWGHI